jgi:carbamoyl-phosphate synthase small subunit
VRILREQGAMRGVISATDLDDARLLERARSVPEMTGLDLTREVACTERYDFSTLDRSGYLLTPPTDFSAGRNYHVVVMDFGVKHNILERLASYGCRLTVVPGSTPPEEILALEPDGIFVSNGPGDPDAVTYAVESLRALISEKPVFGICLGHQLLALALGAKTYKLKFGHRGANHPVQNTATGANEITSQNHGFAVDLDSMQGLPVELTHVNLNDRTVEGFRHRELPVFCVQYHPEAGPGPHDADYLFRQFIEMMDKEMAHAKA